MSHTTSAAEQFSKTSPRSRIRSGVPVPVVAETEPSPRSHDGSYQSGTTLPSVATITARHGYQGGSPHVLTQGSSTPTRSLGMHSILNPSDTQQTQPRIPAQSPAVTSSLAYGNRQPLSVSPHIRKREDRTSPSVETVPMTGVRQGRRVLTPKSPGKRAASLGAARSPSLPAAPAPHHYFLNSEGRVYTAEPGEHNDSTIPPLPLPPLSIGPPINAHPTRFKEGTDSVFPTMSNPSSLYSAPSSMSRDLPSPETSKTSYSQPGPSPSLRSVQSSGDMTPMAPPTSQAAMLDMGKGQQRQNQPPKPQFQMGALQLHPTGGERFILPVEVDMHQASRSSDEKRKRNAGASARFRARRKEKEKEASQAINDLQQQLREVADERDFYIGERNFFRDFVVRNVGSAKIPLRPASPLNHRITGMQTGHRDSSSSVDYHHRDAADSVPPQLRPTIEYQATYAATPPRNPSHSQSYISQLTPSYAMPVASGPPNSFPDNQTSQQQSQKPTSRSHKYDPFHRDLLR